MGVYECRLGRPYFEGEPLGLFLLRRVVHVVHQGWCMTCTRVVHVVHPNIIIEQYHLEHNH